MPPAQEPQNPRFSRTLIIAIAALTILVVAMLAVGTWWYLSHTSSQKILPSLTSIQTIDSSDIDTSHWPVYATPEFSVAYPPELTPIIFPIPYNIRFAENGNRSATTSISIFYAPIAQRSDAQEISENVKIYSDMLTSILQLEKGAFAGFSGTNVFRTAKVQLGDHVAAQFGVVDTSIPDSPTYWIKTSFYENERLVDITLNADYETESASIRPEYTAMLKSLKINQTPSESTDTAIIDSNSLAASSPTPTITGTYAGDRAVGIVIVKGAQALPKSGSFSNLPDAVAVGYSDHGGTVQLDSPGATSGKFSYTVSTPLQNGSYTVGVYVYHNIYTSQGYQSDSAPELIVSGILLVH